MRYVILQRLKKRLWMKAKGEITQGQRTVPGDRQKTSYLLVSSFLFVCVCVCAGREEEKKKK